MAGGKGVYGRMERRVWKEREEIIRRGAGDESGAGGQSGMSSVEQGEAGRQEAQEGGIGHPSLVCSKECTIRRVVAHDLWVFFVLCGWKEKVTLEGSAPLKEETGTFPYSMVGRTLGWQ